MVDHRFFKRLASFFGVILTLAFAMGGSQAYAVKANKAVVAEKVPSKKKSKKTEGMDLADVFKLLDAGTTIHEQFLEQGGASAINQIATSYYVMAESMEDREKAVDYYKQAAHYFEKAAEAGNLEARYNAGLVRSKLGEYEAAAEHYWLCCKWTLRKENVTIVLKAALNWVVLIVEGNDHPSVEKFKRLLGVLQGYKANFAETADDDKMNTERAMNAVAALNAFWRGLLEENMQKGVIKQTSLSDQKHTDDVEAVKAAQSQQQRAS